MIVVSHSQMGAVEAEVLGIPIVNVTLQTEMIPEKLKEKSFKDKLIGNMIAFQMAKPYNKIRKKHHLPKIKSSDEIMSKELNLIPISPYVTKPSPYWEEQHKMVGYWYIEDKDYQPDEELRCFLEKGEKPIILALGAMSFESEKEQDKLELFIRAFQKTGMRAVIQGFQKTLVDYELPETMIAVGSVPHSWLFRQGYCVIHHCGFGTASSSMIYGIPSILVPHVLDQFGFAMRLHELGVAGELVKASELSEERMIEAIEDMKAHYEERKACVVELSEKLQQEKGLEKAVALIIGELEKGT